MRLPTVTISTKKGPVVINECDFDSKVHKKARLKKPPVKKAAAKKAAPRKTKKSE